MYQADRRPWLRVRIDPPSPSPSPSPSPASSFRASLRLDRWGAWAWGGGVTSSLVLLLLLLSGEGSGGSGDSARGASSSVFTARGRPRRLGVDAVPESDNTDVSCADDVPPSSPVDWSRSSSGVELLRLLLLLISSSSCLLFLPLFLPGGRPRGLEGLPGVAASGGLTGASARDFRPLLPTPTVTWLLWPFKWTVLGDEGLTGEPEFTRRKYVSVAGRTDQMYIFFWTISLRLTSWWQRLLPGVCRTGVLSFLRVLPPPLLSVAGEGVTFSGAGGVEADTELWALSERVDSVDRKHRKGTNKNKWKSIKHVGFCLYCKNEASS